MTSPKSTARKHIPLSGPSMLFTQGNSNILTLIYASKLAGSSASAVSVTGVSLANSDISDNGISASQTEASNFSSNATIAITMYAVDDVSSSDTDTATVVLRARTVGSE